MKRTQERFACIFYPSFGSLALLNVTLVNYDIFTKHFKIEKGVCKGTKDYNLNLITGNPNFIYGIDTKCKIAMKNDIDIILKPSIYVFSNSFVNKIKRKHKLNNLEAYLFITKKAEKIKIENICNNEFLATKEDNPLILSQSSVFDKDTLKRILYEDIDNKKDEDSKKCNVVKNVSIGDLMTGPGAGALMFTINGEPEIVSQEEPEKKTNERLLPMEQLDVPKIINEIECKIIGQSDAITTLVSNVYYNQLLIDSIKHQNKIDLAELDSRKVNILLDGSTGTGKTAIAKLISSKFNLPIVITNANSFSETGYVGPTITDLLKKLLTQTDGNIEEAERGIIVLDEIDKLAVNHDYSHDMKKGVQEELLSFIGGGKYDVSSGHGFLSSKESFDTSKITFILMGAFTDIRDKKIKEKEGKIGFKSIESDAKTYEITPQDYIDYGLMREFFGRIKVLASTKSYTKEDLKNILLNSEISPLKNLEKTVELYGYSGINYSDEFIDRVIDEAYEMNTGARGLQTVMSGIQNLMLYDLTIRKYDLNKSIMINDELIEKYQKSKIRNY